MALWDEIETAIFDASTASGLEIGFLGNLISETYGLIFGAVVSVAIANYLDSRREGKRLADHRVRAANRWLKNHNEMLLSVREAGGQDDFDRRRLERRDTVLAAVQYAEGIREDYSDALEARRIAIQFLHYTQALEKFADVVFEHRVRTDIARAASREAYAQLSALISATAPRGLRGVFAEPLDNLGRTSDLQLNISKGARN